MYKAARGTVDILPVTSDKWQQLEQLIRTVCATYNAKEIRTPIFEQTELFNRAVGDTTDVVSKEMYTFEDKKGRSLTLRPEGTAGVVRSYVENKLYTAPDKVSKLYYMGPMFRYERPQNGRQRQFHQFGVEMIGIESAYLDVECMTLAVTLVEALGLKGVKLHINTLGDDVTRENYRKALIEHFGSHVDDLCHDCKERFNKNPLRILDCKVDSKHTSMADAPKMSDYLSDDAKKHFNTVCSLLDDLEIEYEIDHQLVRGLDYYCHTVFEVISNDDRLGNGATLGGGGRYNGLVEELGGPSSPGVGFAFGMERLLLALDENLDETEGLDIYVMPLDDVSREMSMQIVTMLRANGYRVDCDYEGRSMKAMFKTLERNDTHFALILGSNEVEKEIVQIKCIHSKEQVDVPFEEILSYLEKHESEAGHE